MRLYKYKYRFMYINRSKPTIYIIYAPLFLKRVADRLLFSILFLGPVPQTALWEYNMLEYII